MPAAKAAEYTNKHTYKQWGGERSGLCRARGLDRQGWWLEMPLGKRPQEAESHLRLKAKAIPSKKKLAETGRHRQVCLYLGQGKQAGSPPNPQPRLARVTSD